MMNRSLVSLAAGAMLAASVIVPAYAETPASAPAMMQNKSMKQKVMIDGACMASAVMTRDTAISTALSSVVTALQTRGQSLSSAWGMTDLVARKAAVKLSNSVFDGTWNTFNAARKNAWSQFRTTAKTCRAASTDLDAPNTSAAM